MRHDLIPSLIWAGGLIAVALAASTARDMGYLGGDAVNRIVLGATGLMIAWYGNRLPKTFAPSAHARRVNRVAGWSMAISGLTYAALWVFAPFPVALIGGCGAVIAGMAVTLGYCLSLRAGARAV
ncbi:ammonium transporter [uncultured Brevundimonas sp.]|uniref:ammonium transporter n=1 Tax=uncultured Brevundimonas sp. TaxID=213418 RepID=UPI002594C375|nr:ammonium transporter [uncultured Brevundimonas sp.]